MQREHWCWIALVVCLAGGCGFFKKSGTAEAPASVAWPAPSAAAASGNGPGVVPSSGQNSTGIAGMVAAVAPLAGGAPAPPNLLPAPAAVAGTVAIGSQAGAGAAAPVQPTPAGSTAGATATGGAAAQNAGAGALGSGACLPLNAAGFSLPSCCTPAGRCGVNAVMFMMGCVALEDVAVQLPGLSPIPTPQPCTPATM